MPRKVSVCPSFDRELLRLCGDRKSSENLKHAFRNKIVILITQAVVTLSAHDQNNHAGKKMATIKAKNYKDAQEMLHSGIGKVELAYDINSDDFFRLASHWCDRGAKISRGNNHFVVSLKGFSIPPNE